MVLSPLPVATRTILLAKVAASAALLGLAVVTLNFATGIAWPLVIGSHHGFWFGFLQSFAAYWFTMVAASVFLFCAVLTVQGFSALLLPRRIFLIFSAMMQLAAFALFLGVFFLQPSLTSPDSIAAPGNHRTLACLPTYWFFALFNKLNSTLPPDLDWLAKRAWISLGTAISGAAASLLLCYLRTMKKTVEEPDLVPAGRGARWVPRIGSQLETAIVLFSLRTLLRSRQHRLAFAFYLALVFSIALSWLRTDLARSAPVPLLPDVLISTFIMMSFAVFGLRSVFSLPISLTANWMLRVTQLSSSESYVSATRRTLMMLAVAPVWIISALLSLPFRPWQHVAIHLTVLALAGWLFVELSLIRFYKVPFTCSYLPGKVHVQVIFWCFLLLVFVFAMVTAEYEVPALNSAMRSAVMIIVLMVATMGLWRYNQRQAKSAALYFEELLPEVITTLGVASLRPTMDEGTRAV
jgi:hypothetical protein